MSNPVIHLVAPTAGPVADGKRRGFGVRTARDLRAAEHQMDQALAQYMALGQTMLKARMEAGFAAAVGQTALEDVTLAISHGVQARAAVIRAHDQLKDVADQHRIGWRLDGPLETKPVDQPVLKPTAAA